MNSISEDKNETFKLVNKEAEKNYRQNPDIPEDDPDIQDSRWF